MATDPFRCDTVFSFALLFAFGSLPAALFTVTLPDWIIIAEKPNHRSPCSDVNAGCAFDGISSVRNATENVTDGFGIMATPASDADALPGTSNASENAIVNISQTESGAKTEQNVERKAKWTPILIANFHYICTRNSGTKTLQCQSTVLTNASNVSGNLDCRETNEAGSPRSFEDTLDCDIQVVRQAMLGLAQYASPLLLSAAAFCVVCTTALNALAILDKGYPAFKFIAGLILLGSAIVQIIILVELRFLIMTIQTSATSEATHGAAPYFSSTNCTMTMIASVLLFVSSYTERLRPVNLFKSNADVPFQNTTERNSGEISNRDEFIKIQDDESEEWGFFPKANDVTKEVRFRLIPNYSLTTTESKDIANAITPSDERRAELSTENDKNVAAATNAFMREDQGTPLAKFASEEFKVEDDSFVMSQDDQCKTELPVKRVVFLLPKDSKTYKDHHTHERESTEDRESDESSDIKTPAAARNSPVNNPPDLPKQANTSATETLPCLTPDSGTSVLKANFTQIDEAEILAKLTQTSTEEQKERIYFDINASDTDLEETTRKRESTDCLKDDVESPSAILVCSSESNIGQRDSHDKNGDAIYNNEYIYISNDSDEQD